MGSVLLQCVVTLEPVLLFAVLGPVLLAPHGSTLPLLGLGAIVLLWAARLVASHGVVAGTPIDLPMLLIMAMAAESLHPSTDMALSLPRLYGIVMVVAGYYGFEHAARRRSAWWATIAVLVAGTAVLSVAGLFLTNWPDTKMPAVGRMTAHLPSLIRQIPPISGPFPGIHPGALGGILAFLVPVSAGLTLWCLLPESGPRADCPGKRNSGGIVRYRWVVLFVSSAVLLLGGAVLGLTWARSAFAGLGVALLALLGLRWHRLGYVVAASGSIAAIWAIVTVAGNPSRWLGLFDGMTSSASTTASTRLEVWNRAIYMIQDFPFTGVGLGNFPIVLDSLYPSFLSGPNARIPHAHNIYLQTAVDLGLAGSMAFVGLWMIVGWQAVSAFRVAADPMTRGAIAGSASGCVAYLVYGLTDCRALGEWEAPVLFMMVALIISAKRMLEGGGDGETRGHGDAGTRRGDELGTAGCHESRRGARWLSHPLLWALIAEVGRMLWRLYWAVAIFFAVMAYLIVGFSITGWTPW